MASIIPGYEYDIFISYRHKDNKYDHWVTDFVSNLRRELEATFRDEVRVYFDSNAADGLLATDEVDESLKAKLRCLVFIPVISHTYCDPASFAWANEFKAFVEHASIDKYGLKVKLPNGNYASRVLPVQIHYLAAEEKILCERILGSKLRSIEFIYSEPGVNRPLRFTEDNPHENLGHTIYRNQINKVANAVKEMITAMANITSSPEIPAEDTIEEKKRPVNEKKHGKIKWNLPTGAIIGLILIISGFLLIPNVLRTKEFVTKEFVEKSIAVLPFENKGPEVNNENFSYGMEDEIINQLDKIRDLKVKVRTTGEIYQNPKRDYRKIGKDLNVSMIMIGSVSKAGEHLRITAQLIDAKTGDQLWSEIYLGDYTEDIFSFLGTVAKKVAASLNIVLTPREKESIEKIPTKDMLAHDFVLKAEESMRKWRFSFDSTYLRLTNNLYDQALKLDPECINALMGKSMVLTEASKFDSALYYSEKIIKIDPDNPYGFTGKGYTYQYWGRFDSALKYYQKAIEIAPDDYWCDLALGQLFFMKNDAVNALSYMQKANELGGEYEAEINHNISWVFFNIGEYEKAKKYVKRGLAIRSECRLLMDYCYLYYAQGKYDAALLVLDSICNIDPCEVNCDMMRFYIYTSSKEYDKAEECYKKAIGNGYKRTEEADIYIACLYKNTGREKEALSILDEFIETNEGLLSKVANNIIAKSRLCASYAILGNQKKVMEYIWDLERGEYQFSYINLNTFPGFDNLRSDPEFAKYLNRTEEEKSEIRKQLKEMEKRGKINL